jgi:hypothetical protein
MYRSSQLRSDFTSMLFPVCRGPNRNQLLARGGLSERVNSTPRMDGKIGVMDKASGASPIVGEASSHGHSVAHHPSAGGEPDGGASERARCCLYATLLRLGR